MRKIAIPNAKGYVDKHFEHSKLYSIYSIDQSNTIRLKETLVAQKGCGCKNNIASELRSFGVSTILLGNVGEGAFESLKKNNIQVIKGCAGAIETTLKQYLNGFLIDSRRLCAHTHVESSCS